MCVCYAFPFSLVPVLFIVTVLSHLQTTVFVTIFFVRLYKEKKLNN